jgi:hypothetical protein
MDLHFAIGESAIKTIGPEALVSSADLGTVPRTAFCRLNPRNARASIACQGNRRRK